MDPSVNVSNPAQDSDTAAKLRFESFKMGGSAPAHTLSKLSHRRSHSRNNSISLSISTSVPSVPAFDFSSSTHVPSNVAQTKRGSHHKRRSSVSTRRESAELMGVSVPDLPSAHSDDNINLGDRDSIRRRALLALEGKPDLAFSKVEIPDITSPDATKTFDFPTKSAFPPTSAINNLGVTGLMGKRDSGKMFVSSVAKDQLHTLIEEEEEEEELEEQNDTFPEQPKETSPPVHSVEHAKPSRPRPTSLNLRPLSLVSGIAVVTSGGLPTPSTTPSPRAGLRALTLSSDITTSETDSIAHPSAVPRSFSRRHSLTNTSSVIKRRSSISYKRSVDSTPRDVVTLPSPEMTPTSDRHFSISSDQSLAVEKPLTVAEQHFLFRSHNVLLTRITELERTLRKRSSLYSPRPLSYSSEVSVGSSEPSDEMLQLISDLKAERDELKRDVDGWRKRVSDADERAGVLAKRIEVERRDAWVARSRLGLLEVEKTQLEKAIEDKIAALDLSLVEKTALTRERDELEEEVNKLKERLQDADATVDECAQLRAALEQERERRQELEHLLDDAGLFNAPAVPRLTNGFGIKSIMPSRFGGSREFGFQSIDSESSTEVESLDDSFMKAGSTLDVVAEEDLSEEEVDALAGYEDEDDSDLSFQSPGGSSAGSAEEMVLKFDVASGGEAAKPLNNPAHGRHATLSKTWTFPRGHAIVLSEQKEDVDHFFGCLDDVDMSPHLGSEERTKGLFASAFCPADDEDEMPPFVLPADIGVVVEPPAPVRSLDTVHEDDEEDTDDEFVGEEVEGGIRFIFNPPPTICITPPQICVSPPTTTIAPVESESHSVPRKLVPVYEEQEPPISQFPPVDVRALPEAPATPSPVQPSASCDSRPSSRTTMSPSSIPRATVLRSFTQSPSAPLTPSKPPTGRSTLADLPRCSFITPPSKKGGNVSTFIPQPKPLPSAVAQSTPTKPRASVVRTAKDLSRNPNGSTKPQPRLSMSTLNSFSSSCVSQPTMSGGATPEVTSYEPSGGDRYHQQQIPSVSLPSIMPSPLSARFSLQKLQKLSNFIPFSWTPGATAIASCIMSSSGSPSQNPDGFESVPLMSCAEDHAQCTTERGFVCRDKQLEKLKSRLSQETFTGTGSCFMVSACKGCRATEVSL
ncbi:hypothetical protein F5J12DRAFT_934248 [Pisolithus orientalis]|uniref:uncharacterized protein n=1 Tax=Pisolithus orientalis TaxID=936130 RepID=UPI00222497D1|nr:uncharacterized protein F5J12DRAFT_934248 [Pisolithus orientalis]KAI6035550.1 hypothetical protein F5J12DRAFT_934248 [Pisolithus orientalis]